MCQYKHYTDGQRDREKERYRDTEIERRYYWDTRGTEYSFISYISLSVGWIFGNQYYKHSTDGQRDRDTEKKVEKINHLFPLFVFWKIDII